MLNKRYQVFVSSTYADLKNERQKVIQTIMEMDCIPAGMELFPAVDLEQFEFIKRIIDDCDYYIIIIGGRYGSLSKEGISYTEKEYDYAIGIGLQVLAFIHKNPGSISVSKSDIDPAVRAKLDDFRERVSATRLVKFWENPEDLSGLVAVSLSKTIKLHPAIGWVRANKVATPDPVSVPVQLPHRPIASYPRGSNYAGRACGNCGRRVKDSDHIIDSKCPRCKYDLDGDVLKGGF